MPPGTRKDASGQLVSGRGLRDTTDFIAKEARPSRHPGDADRPVAVRGVEVTRFVSQRESTPFPRDPRHAGRG